jgi:hypothetical protein
VRAAFYLVLLGLDVFWIDHTPKWIPGQWWVALLGAAWLLFFLTLAAISRTPKKAAATLILAGAIGLPLAAGFAPIRNSDDVYRYLWDGKVQAAHIDPYRYAPADPQLVPLHDNVLWPKTSAWCVPSGCTLISRPTEHTMFAPVAQAYFTGLHYLSPKVSRELPAQLGAAAFVVATTVLLLVGLPRLGLNRRLAAVWALCPLVALEAGNNARVDVLAAFFTAAALLVLARARGFGRAMAGGGLLGLAAAVNFIPALVVPSALRRRPVSVVVGVVFATAAVYLPHLLAVGSHGLRYLPARLAEVGQANGDRFALLSLAVPAKWAPIAAIAILAVTACWALAMSNPDRPWDTAVVTVGMALIVAGPGHAWLAMPLVVLVALSARYEWLAVGLAAYVALYAHELHLSGRDAQVIAYGSAAAIVALAGAYRWRRARGPIGPLTAAPLSAATVSATTTTKTATTRRRSTTTSADGGKAAGSNTAQPKPRTARAKTAKAQAAPPESVKPEGGGKPRAARPKAAAARNKTQPS